LLPRVLGFVLIIAAAGNGALTCINLEHVPTPYEISAAGNSSSASRSAGYGQSGRHS
jgi:hypothetical protein